MLIILYLLAIVAANISATIFGPVATIINSFLFIGLDITTRDMLHEHWEHKHLWSKMGVLILAGSGLSWAVNRNAGPIALASFVAFAAAGATDTIVYHLLRERSKLVKVNGSNLVSSAVDSILFPTIAFGAFIPWVVAGQFIAKVAGGFLWAIVLNRFWWRKTTAEGS